MLESFAPYFTRTAMSPSEHIDPALATIPLHFDGGVLHFPRYLMSRRPVDVSDIATPSSDTVKQYEVNVEVLSAGDAEPAPGQTHWILTVVNRHSENTVVAEECIRVTLLSDGKDYWTSNDEDNIDPSLPADDARWHAAAMECHMDSAIDFLNGQLYSVGLRISKLTLKTGGSDWVVLRPIPLRGFENGLRLYSDYGKDVIRFGNDLSLHKDAPYGS